MLVDSCQRWRERRGTYRPAGETIATNSYEVALIESDTIARTFVERHHYSQSFPAARLKAGLYRGGELVGVAVLSQPSSQAALDAALPFPGANRAELGRLVLLDDVPANGESWFIARTFELARREGFEFLVSHADPMPRHTASGEVTMPGHLGIVYQATNAVYTGLTERRTRRMCADGLVLDGRMMSKLRARHRGVDYAIAKIVAQGATPPLSGWRSWSNDAWHAWCDVARDQVSRPVRHTGNHRYLFSMTKQGWKRLPKSKPYPKLEQFAAVPQMEAA